MLDFTVAILHASVQLIAINMARREHKQDGVNSLRGR
jgi:hypothetical protein